MMVLLVEDDAATSRALVELLTRAGYTTVAVAKGADALRVLGTIKPACLVLDLDLPDCGGLQVLQRVKRQAPLADVPVVVYSAEPDPAAREQAQAMGADWVPKSAGATRLVATIQSYDRTLA